MVQSIWRLICIQRRTPFSRLLTSLAHIKQLERDSAGQSEDHLSILPHPLETTVIGPEEQDNPVWNLKLLLEAYQSTGVIQIYYVDPDIFIISLPDAELYPGPEVDSLTRPKCTFMAHIKRLIGPHRSSSDYSS